MVATNRRVHNHLQSAHNGLYEHLKDIGLLGIPFNHHDLKPWTGLISLQKKQVIVACYVKQSTEPLYVQIYNGRIQVSA
jgi:hypothetical protein